MKIITILLLLFVGVSSASGQEKAYKNVGVIYDLSDSIWQNHVGLTMFDNFVKTYPQDDNVNLVIEELLDKEIKQINGLEVHKLEYSADEINNMIEKDDMSPISSYDMILVIKDFGTYSQRGHLEGRGINTGFKKTAQIYASLGVELINTSNGEKKSYDLNNNKNGFKWRMNAVLRTKKKYFSSSENKKELSDAKVKDIQENLIEMYRLQVEKLFAADQLFKTVSELYIEK